MEAGLMGGGRKRRIKVHEKAGGRCEHCGIEKTLLTVDHVIPKLHGGKDDWSNYKAACSECNSLKGIMSEEEFRERVLPLIMYRRRRMFSPERQSEIIAAYSEAKNRKPIG